MLTAAPDSARCRPTFMFEKDQNGPRSTGRSSPSADQRSAISSRFEQFEKRQGGLWRLSFVVFFFLGLAYVVTSWDTIRSLAHRYEALPIGLVVLIALFGAY